MSMFMETGMPFEGDPRYALERILKNYETKGLKVLAATEMEFHLIDESKNSILPPINPISKNDYLLPIFLAYLNLIVSKISLPTFRIVVNKWELTCNLLFPSQGVANLKLHSNIVSIKSQ